MVGIKAYLLKPNRTSIGATAICNGAVTSSSGNTITIDDADDDLDDVLPVSTAAEWGSARTDWIYIESGTYNGYHWRIRGYNDTTKVVTIDGTVPANLGTPNYQCYQAVDAKCAWTDPTTVTHFECEAQNIITTADNELKLTRYANRGIVIVNIKKFKGTGAIVNMNLGNRSDTIDFAGRIEKFWDYAQLYWPSISPKYCLLFRYNYPTGSEYTGTHKYYGGSYTCQRCIPGKPQFEEDPFNNLTLKQVELEMI